jgi:Ca2+-binding EF-hand superfamily protein
MSGAKDENYCTSARNTKSPRSSRSITIQEERSTLARSTKNIVKLIESQYISGLANEEGNATLVATTLLQEAMKLAGLQNFQPTQKQISTFVQLMDQDEDGKISSNDLEGRVDYYLKGCPCSPDNYNSGNSRSHKSTSGISGGIVSERVSLRRSLTNKFKTGFKPMIDDCKALFDKYDHSGEGTIEYDYLLPLLSDVYGKFGMNIKPAPQDTRRYIDAIDTDRDGVISWSDFELFLLRVLDSLENVEKLPTGQPAKRQSNIN